LESILKKDLAGLRPVVAMHHPPRKLHDSGLRHYLDGLQGYERLINILSGRRAIVLHGHTHQQSDITVDDIRIIGVPSASVLKEGDSRRNTAFHTLLFDQNGDVEITATSYHSSERRFETVTLETLDF